MHLDPSLRCRTPAALDLLALWRARCPPDRLPDRTGFEPWDLKPFLGDVLLVEIEPEPLRMRYRLIGTAITQRMGRDNTGRYFDEIYDPTLLAQLEPSFRWLLARRRPLRTFGRAFYDDKAFYDYETLHLPLSRDGENVTMSLAGLYFISNLER